MLLDVMWMNLGFEIIQIGLLQCVKKCPTQLLVGQFWKPEINPAWMLQKETQNHPEMINYSRVNMFCRYFKIDMTRHP